MSELDKNILKLRQKMGLDTRIGYLGNGSGEVHDRRYPGRYYVRFSQSGGGYTAPVSIPANPNANLPTSDGLPIDVGYDASGAMIILRANVPGMAESGYNTLQLNPLDQQIEKLINQTQITTFYTARHTDLNNKPFYAVVFPGFLYIGTVITYFAGNEINLVSLQPSAGDHVFAVVFIKNDATLEAFASTAINTSDPLTTVDIQEAINAATAGSQPIWAFEITGDDTELTIDPARQVDLRAIVGGGVLGSGGGTVTSVALSASPAGVFDVSGSPVTSSGTLALSLDSQVANTVLAGPMSGGAATPGFRSLVAADIPQLAHSSLSGLTTGDDHTQYLLRQPSADWTIDASALRMGAIGGAAVAAQKLTIYTGADANVGLQIRRHSNSQSQDLMQFSTNAGTYLSGFSPSGYLGIGLPTTTIPASVIISKTSGPLVYLAHTQTAANSTNTSDTALYVQCEILTSSATNELLFRPFNVRITNSLTGGGILQNARGINITFGTSTNSITTAFDAIYIENDTAKNGTVTTGRGLRITGLQGATQEGVRIQSLSATSTNAAIVIDNQSSASANFAIQTNAGNVVFNEGGDANSDFRVEGDTDANLLFTDASADSIGIGTASPTAFLHLKAATTAAASLRIPVGTAPTSPNAGDVWHDSTQKSLIGFLAGIKQSLLGVLFTQTADKTVANTVTETTLFTTGIGSVTLPANFFVVGKDIRIRAKGYFSTSGNPNIQFKIKYGSTVLLDSGAFSAGAGVSNHLWFLDAVITCRTTGSSGTIFAQGFGKLYTAHATVTEFDIETTATTTINTTTSNALDLTITWGTADAGNTITATNISVEVLN